MFQFFQQGVDALQDIAKALHDADRTNIVLAGSTIVLAIATIIFGIFDKKRTNKQIRNSEKRADDEHFERVRPWIIIESPLPEQVVFSDETSMLWDEFNEAVRKDPSISTSIKIVKYVIKFTNRGARVAKNLKKIQDFEGPLTTRQIFESKPEIDMHTDLGPTQSQNSILIFTLYEYLNLNDNPRYISYRISYGNGRTRSVSGIMYKITLDQTTQLEAWYD
jgi:hypothetical protein